MQSLVLPTFRHAVAIASGAAHRNLCRNIKHKLIKGAAHRNIKCKVYSAFTLIPLHLFLKNDRYLFSVHKFEVFQQPLI